MRKITIKNIDETNYYAEKLASMAFPGMLITLEGDLGAGKTTFTKAFGKALGIKKTINSPTFTILKTYNGDMVLHHIDAYRLENIEQDLGFDEIFEQDDICVVEWAQFIENFLPDNRINLKLTRVDEDQRVLEINAIGKKYQTIEESL